MIGSGRRKRAASTNASSWVLSPISAERDDAGRDEECFHETPGAGRDE